MRNGKNRKRPKKYKNRKLENIKKIYISEHSKIRFFEDLLPDFKCPKTIKKLEILFFEIQGESIQEAIELVLSRLHFFPYGSFKKENWRCQAFDKYWDCNLSRDKYKQYDYILKTIMSLDSTRKEKR